MFKLFRMSYSYRKYFILLNNSICNNLLSRNYSNSLKNGNDLLRQSQQMFTRYLCLTNVVLKRDKKSAKENRSENLESDDEDDYNRDDSIDDDLKEEKGSKVIKSKVNSLRADLVIKAGLGIARNKIETIFYESRVRVNGLKIPKKSIQVNIGDDIDIIRGFSPVNPTFLIVSRVTVLSATSHNDGFLIQLRRFKRLLVENYAGSNAFKSSMSNLA